MKPASRTNILISILAMVATIMPTFAAGKATSGLNGLPGTTADDDCDKWCSLPKGKDRLSASVVIDANTCQILEGGTRFAEGEKVQVIFVNKNPFKYSYRFQVVSQPLDTAIVTSFLGLIPGFGSTLDALSGSTAPLVPKSNPCSGAALTESNAIVAGAKQLEQQSKDIATQLNEITKKVEPYQKKYNTFFKATDVDNIISYGSTAETLACRDLCTQAKALVTDLPAIDPTAVRKAIEALQSKITELETRTNALAADCKDFTLGQLTPLTNPRKEDLKNYNKRLDELGKAKETFEQMVNIIKIAFASENPFVEVKYPQTSGGPTGVSISAFRKNLRNPDAKEQELCKLNLQVGESPLSISAGFGFSTIKDRKVIRQPFAKADGTIGAKFGEENNSTFRPSAVVMLNASLRRFNMFAAKDGSFAVSTGLVLSNRNGTTEAEFIIGPSIGLLTNRVFLTFGYHAARVEQLGGGFKLGDDIPASITDPLPIERNWKGGFMFGLTYKLR